MSQTLARSLPHLMLAVLAGTIGLLASLGLALQARPDATRLALLVLPWGEAASWRAIDRAGLPVVRVLWGGFLIVLDGSQAPEGLRRLRAGPFVLLDAALVPGCGPPGGTSQAEPLRDPVMEGPSDEPHS